MDRLDGMPVKVRDTLMPDHKGQEQVVVLDTEGIPHGCYPHASRAYLYCWESLAEALSGVEGYDGVRLREGSALGGWEVWTVGARGRLEYRILPVMFRD